MNDDLRLFMELLQKYGIVKAFTIIMALNTAVMTADKVRHFYRKYVSKTFVSFNSVEILQSEIKIFRRELEKMSKTVSNTKIKELEKERYMEAMQFKLQNVENRSNELDYIFRDISTSLKTNNRIVGEYKDSSERLESLIAKVNNFLETFGDNPARPA